MAGKFEMDTSRAGILSRDGSATGNPVSGLTPDGIITCCLGVGLGVMEGTDWVGVGVGICVLVWQAVKTRIQILRIIFFTFEF